MNKLGTKILKMVGVISLISMIFMLLTIVTVFWSMFSQLKTDAKNIVTKSVSSIDPGKLEKVIESKSMKSVEYKEIQQSMIEFKNDKDIKYFYTMVKDKNGKVCILVDASLTNTSPLGDMYDMETGMASAFRGTPAFTNNLTSDEYGTFISAYAPIKNSAGEIIAIAGVDKDVASFLHVRNILLLTTGIAATVLLILSVLMSFLFSGKISKSVKNLENGLGIMAKGDLTKSVNINTGDEIQAIAESVNNVRVSTVGTLNRLKKACETILDRIASLSATSEEMASSSQEVAAVVEEVANGTNTQSCEITRINDTMGYFGSQINQTVKDISSINSKIDTINSEAINSNQSLTNLEEALKGINLSFASMKSEINELGTCLSQIGEITSLINTIAGQTNLLAINAAIEAASAGEVGKGFAVVAEEIRKLAEQSKNSAASINKLLGNVTAKSDNVTLTTYKMDEKLKDQIAIISKSISSFKEIVNSVEEIIPRINAVSSHMNTINNEKETIIKSIEASADAAQIVSDSSRQIASSSQELSASLQEVAASVQDLSMLSNEMMEVMGQFKI